MDEKLELLSKVPLLAGLDRRDLEEVGAPRRRGRSARRSRRRPQGASGDEFFVILDGTVRIERDGEHLRDLGPGDFFGELALLGDIPRTATATCTTACRLIVVGHREFHQLLSQFPTIQGAVLEAVAAADRSTGRRPARTRSYGPAVAGAVGQRTQSPVSTGPVRPSAGATRLATAVGLSA